MTRSFLASPTPASAIAFAIALWAPFSLAVAQSADPPAAAGDTTETAADAAADTTADATIATGAESSASTDASTSADATIAIPAAEAQPGATADVPQTGADAQLDAAAANPPNLPNLPTRPADATAQPQQPGQPQQLGQPATSADAQIQAGAQPQADLSAQPQLGRPGANVNVAADLGLQFGAATARGLTLNAIDRVSFFANSDLRARDVLVSFSGQPVRSYADFQRIVALYPGQRVPVIILRDGREQTVYITAPATRSIVPQPGAPLPSQPIAQASLGVTFDPQFPNLAIVREVKPGSPAEHAGLRSGDQINALNGQRTGTPQLVIDAVARMRPGQEVQIEFSRRAAVLLAENSAVRHSVGYAPQATTQPATVLPATRQPAPPQTRVLVPGDGPDAIAAPGARPRGLNSRDLDDDGDIIRPGDADRDGRILDGDGRLRQRDDD
jgi:membrane-associated protease RseP (regulator of RpoE activity)